MPLTVWVRIDGATPTTPVAPKPNATKTASSVLIDGKAQAFDAYNIGGNNYFKLRDIASILSGSEKQFEVGYDNATKAITLTSGTAYTPVGGELTAGTSAASVNAKQTTSALTLDGQPISLSAYTIGGNNYFKLRDLGQAFDFGVTYDSATNTVVVDTAQSYVAP